MFEVGLLTDWSSGGFSWVVLGHFGSFLGRSGSFWVGMDRFGSLWIILARFGTFWVVLADSIV